MAMTELIRKDALLVDCEKRSWQEAVRICGGLMHSEGSISAEYTEAMVEAVATLGPYMVIAPHIALAHAAAVTYVAKDDLVLVVFKEPVIFGSHNDPVHLVFGLCATGADKHLSQLQALTEILGDKEICTKLLNCDDVDGVYRIINRS